VKHVVGLSGGKDSTALALRLLEVEPRDYTYLITPTGDELPDMIAHWERLEKILGKPLTRVTAKLDLNGFIVYKQMLPNFRSRWCTQMLKVTPTIAWVRANNPVTMYVGLRADEETREGIYAEDVKCRFPLREWGWGINDVLSYLDKRGICIPKRTDCARCYHQRLSEWRDLWRDYPEIYADAEAQEEMTGHTFRSPERDTWPASLKELRVEFENGRKIRGDGKKGTICRVCSL
jgi:hypothetical protein